jgi:hypothetical protein
MTQNIVAVFAGRFQPFHRGHYRTYKNVANRFGESNTYIATSDKVNPPRSPLNFNQKKRVITSMFDVPPSHVVQVKNTYMPKAILDNFDPETTAYVTAVSVKDKDRLQGSSYFKELADVKGDLKPFSEEAYVYRTPMAGFSFRGKEISGTRVRSMFRDPDVSESEKRELFQHIYGAFDPEIFNLLTTTLTEMTEQQLRQIIREEARRLLGEGVSDSRWGITAPGDPDHEILRFAEGSTDKEAVRNLLTWAQRNDFSFDLDGMDPAASSYFDIRLTRDGTEHRLTKLR